MALEEGDEVGSTPEAVGGGDEVGGLEGEGEGDVVGDEVPFPRAGEAVETL